MIKNSSRKDKRLMLVIGNKKIHFGSPNGFTFIDGATEKTKQNYLKRHSVNEDWSKVNAGSLSKNILWGDSSNIQTNIKNYINKIK